MIDTKDTPTNGFALLQALKMMYGRDNLEHYSTIDKQAEFFHVTRKSSETIEHFVETTMGNLMNAILL